ncbi:MAG TPA: hypothetical protein VLD65_07810 [Anaerolineales bacterium]|nr:hypothetical protein [Anaerolineales bacterium]
MDFGYVLKRAGEIIWKFKVLWVFGILASCSQASGTSGSNSGYRFSSQDGTLGHQIEQYFNQLNPAIITFLIVIAILVTIALIVLVILLATVGRVGLIRGTVKAEQGASKLTFGELWRDGLAYFWRVFGLNLVLALIIFFGLVAIAFLGIILSIGTLGIFLICLIPLLCLIIPAMWLVSIIVEQANVAMVVENLDIMDAIKRGWQVFIDNIGSMIVMGIILVVGVGIVGGLIIGLPLLAITAPAALGFASGVLENIRNGVILTVVLFLVYLPFLLVFSGILRAYTQSAWALTFLRLTTKPSPLPEQAPPAPISGEDLPAQVQ